MELKHCVLKQPVSSEQPKDACSVLARHAGRRLKRFVMCRWACMENILQWGTAGWMRERVLVWAKGSRKPDGPLTRLHNMVLHCSSMSSDWLTDWLSSNTSSSELRSCLHLWAIFDVLADSLSCLTGWFWHWMGDWQVGCWLTDCVVCWLTCWWTDRLTDKQLNGYFAKCLTDSLLGWWIEWLTDQLDNSEPREREHRLSTLTEQSWR